MPLIVLPALIALIPCLKEKLKPRVFAVAETAKYPEFFVLLMNLFPSYGKRVGMLIKRLLILLNLLA